MGIQLISEHEGIIMKVIVFDHFMAAWTIMMGLSGFIILKTSPAFSHT